MKIKCAQLEDSFIPEFNGNNKLPNNEQIVVNIKSHVSNLQLSKYRNFSSDGKTTSVDYDDASMARLHIGEIKNLEDDNGKIKDGADLADSTNTLLYPLMVEIRNHLLNEGEVLPEGES